MEILEKLATLLIRVFTSIVTIKLKFLLLEDLEP